MTYLIPVHSLTVTFTDKTPQEAHDTACIAARAALVGVGTSTKMGSIGVLSLNFNKATVIVTSAMDAPDIVQMLYAASPDDTCLDPSMALSPVK